MTDANLLLGRLPADVRLGGEMPLSDVGVADALAELGGRLGISAIDAAAGVVRVIEAEMERALRRITQERGVDPRGLSLVSFGGAGGLHAVSLARSLGMKEVLVPPDPGILSAAGMLLAPQVELASRAVMEELDAELLERLTRETEAWEERGRSRLLALPGPGPADGVVVERELSLRFRGQSHELDIPWTTRDPVDLFHETYRERYGFCEDRPVEVTAVRSRVLRPSALSFPLGRVARKQAVSDRIPVLFPGNDNPTLVPRESRDALRAGDSRRGPVIIEESSSTFWLPPGASLDVEEDGSLAIAPGRDPD